MPNRILKDSICTSENIDGLSAEAEVFFYRLLVNCDDFGLMDGRISILKAKLYPLRDIPTETVNALLFELEKAELIYGYVVEEKNYIAVKTWGRHQQVRAKRSKYPQPNTGAISRNQLIADDSNGNQLIANAGLIQSNPIQSNPINKDGEVFEMYSANIGDITPMVREHLIDCIRETSAAAVLHGIEQAVAQNVRKLNYIETCAVNKHNGFDPKSKHDRKPPEQKRVPTLAEVYAAQGKTL